LNLSLEYLSSSSPDNVIVVCRFHGLPADIRVAQAKPIVALHSLTITLT
jgi:hypothetical protein